MKRIAWILAAVVLAAAVAFALLVALLPRETLKTRIGEQIAAWTGRPVSLRGEPQIEFFPELTVTLKDVQVGGPPDMSDAAIVSMERLRGTIRLVPLLIGRVEIGSFAMVRPLIRLVRDDRGARNWDFESGAAALQLAFAGDVPLGNFVLEDGTLLYDNRKQGVSERIDSLNLAVAWTSVRRPLSISGSGIWRGELVSVSAGADAPFDFINRKATPLTARLDSAPLSMTFSGTAADIDAPRLTGDIDLSTNSLRGFSSWLGSRIGPGSTLGQASLSGTAELRERVLSVANAELSLDGNKATGALDLTIAAKPAISGTLAFSSLALTPYFAGLAGAFEAGRDWRKVHFDTDWLRHLGADIRLSADTAEIGALRFGGTAASVSLRDARLEISLAEAAFNGGSMTGSLAVTDAAKGKEAAVTAQLKATGFDLAAAAPSLGLPGGLSGTASVVADVTGRGRNLGALVATLGGTARLNLENGAFPLFGIAEIAKAAGGATGAVEQSPLSAVATPVMGFTAGFSLAGGLAVLERGKIIASAFGADVTGWIGLADGTLGLSGSVQPGAPLAPTGAPASFTIDGTLFKPVARPLALAN